MMDLYASSESAMNQAGRPAGDRIDGDNDEDDIDSRCDAGPWHAPDAHPRLQQAGGH